MLFVKNNDGCCKTHKKRRIGSTSSDSYFTSGKKVTQQDVLDACVNMGIVHLEELEALFGTKIKISKKRLQELLDSGESFDYETKGSIDEDLYGE